MAPGSGYFPTVRREPYVVCYWRCNDSAGSTQALDYASRFNLFGVYNGSPSSGPALIQSDLSAASYKFGGAGQNISVGDSSPLRITGDMSIEAWIVSYAPAQTATIVGKMNSGGTIAAPYALGMSSGAFSFAVGNGSNSTSLVGGVPRTSIPTHVVATSFRGSTTIYLNAEVVATGSLSTQVVSDGGQPLYIGSIGSATGFNGLVGEVALYSGALSARRITRHFDVGMQVLSDPSHQSTLDPPVYS